MRNILILLSAVCVLNTAKAQDFKFGIKGGVNFANLRGDAVGLNPIASFHVGVVAETEIYDKFSFQVECLFSSQGAEDIIFNETIRTNYLNLPLLAKYYVLDDFSIEAGPQIGLLLTAKAEFDGREEDIKQFLRTVGLGLIFGLGYKLDNGLNFGMRYIIGLTSIESGSKEPAYDFFRTKHTVFQLFVGFFF